MAEGRDQAQALGLWGPPREPTAGKRLWRPEARPRLCWTHGTQGLRDKDTSTWEHGDTGHRTQTQRHGMWDMGHRPEVQQLELQGWWPRTSLRRAPPHPLSWM